MTSRIDITLVKSMIGRPEKHRKVLRALGLTRVNQVVQKDNTPAVQGMIRKVPHLVRATEAQHETA